MKKLFYGMSAAAAALMAPISVFAAVSTDFENTTQGLGGIAQLFRSFLDYAVPFLIACAVVYFLYGVLQYVIMGDDEEKKEKAKSTILYGIVGIFVMVSVYGLVTLLKKTFNLEEQGLTAPTLDTLQ
ncbi:MAG: hypothetical protein AAB391_01645 [Patescibacteria group bacterium]